MIGGQYNGRVLPPIVCVEVIDDPLQLSVAEGNQGCIIGAQLFNLDSGFLNAAVTGPIQGRSFVSRWECRFVEIRCKERLVRIECF